MEIIWITLPLQIGIMVYSFLVIPLGCVFFNCIKQAPIRKVFALLDSCTAHENGDFLPVLPNVTVWFDPLNIL